MWLTLCLLAVATNWLGAQTVSSSVQGRVYDTTGAAIPEVSVTVVNAATGISRTVHASATGDYQITLLPPGDYTVTEWTPVHRFRAAGSRCDDRRHHFRLYRRNH